MISAIFLCLDIRTNLLANLKTMLRIKHNTNSAICQFQICLALATNVKFSSHPKLRLNLFMLLVCVYLKVASVVVA